MKNCVLPLVLVLAACAKTSPSVITTHTPQPEMNKITETELVNIYEHDTIGAVVSLLQTPSVQAASDVVKQQPELPKENGKVQQIIRKQNQERSPKPPVTKSSPPKPKPKSSAPTQPKPLASDTPIVAPENVHEVPTLAEIAPIAASNNVYVSAQKAYQQRKYHQVVELLRKADGGGDGSVSARKQMYLLLLAHHKLQNCQSVISIGQRLAGQFSGNNESAEAQFMVGQCQWNIQQRDIAKETWRRLIASQPQSAAAKRAKISLEQK